jgi:hypothetical protein
MSERRAIVTLAIGESFRRRWREICEPNWRGYAERHGYDLICVDEPLDMSERACLRSPAWQKCLILSQPFSARYDRMVWLDSDILIAPGAPDVCAGVPVEKVGAVDEFGIPSPALHRLIRRKQYAHWRRLGVPFIDNPNPRSYYSVYGLSRGFDHVVQTGVMVLSPKHHRDMLERTYRGYEDKGPGWNYEMRPLSYEMLSANCVHWIDPRFNFLFGIYQSLHYPFLDESDDPARRAECLSHARRSVHFLHFAGSTQHMGLAASLEPEVAGCDGTLPPADASAQPEYRGRSPVALFMFNRPETTRLVFDAIRAVRPSRLAIIADGPRPDVPGDEAACAEARSVLEWIDWPCDVRTLLSPRNMGLRARIESGLSWLFSQFEEAVILEDDCVPEPTFFRFCDEMLGRYREDTRVLSVSGSSFQFGAQRGSGSYYLSRHGHVWGWATWRRAWALHDPEMADWPAARRDRWLETQFSSPVAQQYWDHIFETAYRTRHTWDFPWRFSYWRRHGMHVIPNANLVSNYGFDEGATHTQQANSIFAFLPTSPMRFPLVHPAAVEPHREADDFTEDILYSGNLRRAFERARSRSAALRAARARADA